MEHPSGILTIDLNAVQANWLELRRQLRAGAECGAVVKANAYGLGMTAVAQALQKVGCRSFFVVNCAEGTALRRALGESPTIYLLQGLAPGTEGDCVRSNLVPVLVSYEMVQRWLAFCQAQGLPLSQRQSALKINTGMNRLGLAPEELQALLADGRFVELGCRLLMSHLACADEPAHSLNQQQLTGFQQQLGEVRQIHPEVLGSLANSAATLQGSEWHFDLVRPGIALYGANATGLPQHRMKPVVELRLPVLQTRRVSEAEPIGYGATYVTERPAYLVTVSGGYGDGLFRSLGNSGSVWCKQSLPIVGRVSMDSFVVDVTALSEQDRPTENAFVELLGSHQTVDDVAEAAGTVAYEVLTRLSGRYARRYLLDGQVFVADT